MIICQILHCLYHMKREWLLLKTDRFVKETITRTTLLPMKMYYL